MQKFIRLAGSGLCIAGIGVETIEAAKGGEVSQSNCIAGMMLPGPKHGHSEDTTPVRNILEFRATAVTSAVASPTIRAW